jgi:hypothetical protein
VRLLDQVADVEDAVGGRDAGDGNQQGDPNPLDRASFGPLCRRGGGRFGFHRSTPRSCPESKNRAARSESDPVWG